jgi:hypothetical protein
MGDVIAALGIEDNEVLTFLDHDRQIIQRHIGAGAGIVESAIGVFLDGDGAAVLRHSSLSSNGLPRPDPRLVAPDCRRKPLIKTNPLCNAVKATGNRQTMVLI